MSPSTPHTQNALPIMALALILIDRHAAATVSTLCMQALCEATGKSEASIKKSYETHGDLGVVAVGELTTRPMRMDSST